MKAYYEIYFLVCLSSQPKYLGLKLPFVSIVNNLLMGAVEDKKQGFF